jgi:hypothetical protein
MNGDGEEILGGSRVPSLPDNKALFDAVNKFAFVLDQLQTVAAEVARELDRYKKDLDEFTEGLEEIQRSN